MCGNKIGIEGGVSGVLVGGDMHGDVYNSNTPKPFNRILTPPPAFSGIKIIGRQSKEDSLHETLNTSGENPVKLSLRSMGGIGKTSLAKVLFDRCEREEHFKHLIWLNGNDEQGLLFVAQDFNIDTKQAGWEVSLSKKLIALPRPCLAVIDNLTLEKQGDFSALINCPNWNILATSRQELDQFTEITLNCLHEDDCIDLYKQHCGFKDDSETVKQLVKKAGRHTLVIELLGKTAEASEKTAANLLRDLEINGFDLSKICKETVDARYWQQDNKIQKKLYEHIKILFNLATLNEQQEINLKQIAMPGTSAHRVEYLEQWLALESKDPLRSLAQTGWIQCSKIEENKQCYAIHPIIVDIALREITLPEEITDRLTDNVGKSLYVDATSHGTEHREKFAATQSLVDYLDKRQYSYSNVSLAYLAGGLASCFYDCGFFQQALPPYKRSLDICESVYGPDHPHVATNLNNIATLYSAQGKYDEALPLYERAPAISEKILGPVWK